MDETTKNERKIYIEVLRILACVMVIYNHTNDRGFHWYANFQRINIIWILDTTMAILSKNAVPIFLMISGGLLIGRKLTVSQVYRKILRILIDLLVFSIFYICLDNIYHGKSFDIFDVVKEIISMPKWHMWYLYMYIAFLISLPVLDKLALSMDFKIYNYLLVTAFVLSGILPIIETFFISVNNSIKPGWMISQIVIYPITGYMIENKLKTSQITNKMIIRLWIMSAVCFIIDLICEAIYLNEHPNDTNEVFLSNFCLVITLTVFVTVKKTIQCSNPNKRINSIIIKTGKCTFGVYLIHLFMLHLWFRFIMNSESHLAIYTSCIMVFLLSCVLIYFLKKIPLIRRFI